MLHLVNRTGWWVVSIWLLAICPAQAEQLRVAVAQKVAQVNVAASTLAIVSDENGLKLGELQPQTSLVATADRDDIAVSGTHVRQLWVRPQAGGYVWLGDGGASPSGGRWYRGALQVVSTRKQLLAINHVDLEQYLYSVLGAEMSANFPAEALKAQAVAARTYALYRSQSTRQKLFDVDSTQTSQAYHGISSEADPTRSAVNATSGQIVTYRGQPILAAFHAASGGHTENVEDIWSDRLPYLRGVPDYDLDTPGSEWSQTFTLAQLAQSLKIPQLRTIAPDRTTQFGSIVSLKVGGITTQILAGSQVRTALKLRSLRFTIAPTSTGFVFKGRGYGHALGMSQWGAYNLAQQGMKYPNILTHYYSGVEIGQLADK